MSISTSLLDRRASEFVRTGQSKAKLLGDYETEPEHILLALLDDVDGIFNQVLRTAAYQDVRRVAALQLLRSDREVKPIISPLSEATDKLIKQSAKDIKDGSTAGPNHLALALIDCDREKVIKIFTALSLDREAVRTRLAELGVSRAA